jgi:hypothetical protein
MIRATPDFPAHSAASRNAVTLRMAVSGVVCALFTSAIVLAQDAKPAPPAVKDALKKPGDAKAIRQREVDEQADVAKIQAIRKAKLIASRDRMIQRFTQQGRPIVRGELLLVGTICELNYEQLRPISRETDQALAAFVLDMSEPRNGVQPQGAKSNYFDAARQLQERVSTVIKKHLKPDQWSLYKSEIDKRDAHRKQAAVSFLLDELNRELFLTSKQHERLRESLSSHWDDRWYLSLEYVLYGNSFYPMDLEQYVVPVLNTNQQKVWAGLQKVESYRGFANMTVGANGDNDDLFVVIGLAEKAPPKPAAPVIKGH